MSSSEDGALSCLCKCSLPQARKGHCDTAIPDERASERSGVALRPLDLTVQNAEIPSSERARNFNGGIFTPSSSISSPGSFPF